MQRIAWLLSLALFACGGGGSADDDSAPPIDAGPDAAPGPCDPFAQTGCPDGQKCTYAELDFNLGTVECVADGTKQLDEACTYGPSDVYPRNDDCAAGLICQNGECQHICDYDHGGGPDACASDADACEQFQGASGFSPFGSCIHECDPVTQERAIDGAPACGSPDPANPDHGCYLRDRTGWCVLVPSQAANLHQDDDAYGPYLNGCAPGFGVMPVMYPNSPTICTAFCRPTEVSVENQAGVEGEPGSGYTCSDRGAAGHECRYTWFFAYLPDASTNGYGLCWDPSQFTYDWDNNPTTPDTGVPACTTWSTADLDGDGTPDNKQHGCAPF
jgi:hypothetical protein